jgi:hypothetical protein
MRNLMVAALAVGTLLVAVPAVAQTYDPAYPFCKKVFSEAASTECIFMTMEQCREGIRSMSAECVANPFYVSSHEATPAPAAAAAPAPARKPRSH